MKKNVYELAMSRLGIVFNKFDNIYISFSGGKDSGVMLNLCIQYVRQHNLKIKIGVFHMDYEVQYNETTRYIDRVFNENAVKLSYLLRNPSKGIHSKPIGIYPQSIGKHILLFGKNPIYIRKSPKAVGSYPQCIGIVPKHVGNFPKHVGQSAQRIGIFPPLVGDSKMGLFGVYSGLFIKLYQRKMKRCSIYAQVLY